MTDDDRLANYLDAAMRPFCDGEHDCAMHLADWVQIVRGVDPAARWRGTYKSEREWRRILREAGGIEPLFRQAAEDIGLRETTEPKRGDVGIVIVPTVVGMLPAGAIWTGRSWAYLMKEGLVLNRAEMIVAWEV